MSINSFPSGTVDRSIGLGHESDPRDFTVVRVARLARSRGRREGDGEKRQSQLRSRSPRDTESISDATRDHRELSSRREECCSENQSIDPRAIRSRLSAHSSENPTRLIARSLGALYRSIINKHLKDRALLCLEYRCDSVSRSLASPPAASLSALRGIEIRGAN